ncbi:prolyl oligopeptidase family serine peptidase [Mucilaginibacter ginsenosidivorans]|uniref:Prolyl oligopeptidase family serine peptidase n=1 Tax=Mucilaginibacter ginsenosidivorans TaxID=398053 RepID=A0A5B8UQP2_9SPHI|nr:prolyl oligopeptidase family serine peptidase [Mucilaginibacter ginsenosidivorans]QEC61397.1 prolyl oligopeptidase family serine peptidase [Mucilaginibacter ginsenosidivorans]
MKKIFTLLLLAATANCYAQKLDKLTVEKIMRDPKWIGTSPSNIYWGDDNKTLYFDWSPDTGRETLYRISVDNTTPVRVSVADRKALSSENGDWNKKHTVKVYEKYGDIFLYDAAKNKSVQLTYTTDRESNPRFSGDNSSILFIRGDNLFRLNPVSGELDQLTNFTHSAAGSQASAGRHGKQANSTASASSQQEKWLKAQQLELFDIIKKEDKETKADEAERKQLEPKKLKEINVDDKRINRLGISPDGRYITYRLITRPKDEKRTIVHDFVTSTGFTEDIVNREKVGGPQSVSESFIFDTQKDTVYSPVISDIPGIKDIPAYIKDYPKELEEYTKRNADRDVVIEGPFWNEDGKNAVVVIAADDNKDRWIMKLDPATGHLKLLDRQHDDAWIGGPGIGGTYYEGNVGWLDNTHFYFQSEASGYSHIYVTDVNTGEKKQLTSGKWEVQTLDLSRDKKTFYFTANMEHPGVTDYYRMPVTGGTPVKLTSMKGGNEVTLSPDEKWLAIRYSYTNKPFDLYLQPNKPGAKAVELTNSVSDEFKSYPWRTPEIITFKNRYGSDVYARVYEPKTPDPAKPAVLFVHGAGYLQNATYSWTHYFREYMFNNLLADNGYYVMDIDYTASAGYGRDWRTGIYRHMGGNDLSDQVDGVKYLIEKYGVNPKHVGMYGGSYGGFMTLMAMFTEPDVFTSGAAIRSVTDWAHYNNGYTANILNLPYTDEKAYRQSSPIYFANGLKGNLLMLHGMVDQNVNFQDIVRLTQKLIELHKDNWWLAPYPVEDHDFHQPSSWTDEYKRIFKLFEETLKK